VVLPFWPPSHIATNIGLGLDDVGLIADPVQQRLASGVIEVGQFRRAQPEGRNRVGIVGRRFRASDREYASDEPHLFSTRRMWSTSFMIEEMRLSIRRRSREEAARLVEEYQQSGLTRTAFCSQHGLSTGTLDYHRKLHRSSSPVAEGRILPVELLPSTPTSTKTEATSGRSLWVDLRNGRRIEVGRGFDGPTLERLVIALEGV
jgi:transposase-like protein